MERLHARIHGRVQGVNFRATTRQQASRLNINGWVRNNADGTVEVVAEGNRDDLESLAGFLREGPPAAQVSSLDTDWQDATGEFTGFDIRM